MKHLYLKSRSRFASLPLLALLVVSAAGQTSVKTAVPDNFWIGHFEHDTSGMNATHTRSYDVWEEILVRKQGKRLVAHYKSGENSDAYDNEILSVIVKGNTAFFYYDHCLNATDDAGPPCEDSPDVKGKLMFKLVKVVGKNGNPFIITYGVYDDELPKKGRVFFKRIKSNDPMFDL